MHGILVSHFLHGVSYPRGGSSEIPYHIIPLIEAVGGLVLVRARVLEIIVDHNNTAIGVRMEKNNKEIRAPLVISDAGLYNTYQKLLPVTVQNIHPEIKKTLDYVRHGLGGFQVFIGFDASNAELGLTPTNIWNFPNADLDEAASKYLARNPDSFFENTSSQSAPPCVFISFPSTKDLTWDARFPGKSTCQLITFVRWEWFEKWQNG